MSHTPPPAPEPATTGTTGLWSVHSASATVYYVDLDRRLLLRQPGPGSPRGATDGLWVPLVKLDVLVIPTDGRAPYLDPTTAITVGHRHHYLLDPGGPDHLWWIQRTVTHLHRIDEAELPVVLPDVHQPTDPDGAGDRAPAPGRPRTAPRRRRGRQPASRRRRGRRLRRNDHPRPAATPSRDVPNCGPGVPIQRGCTDS